MKVSRLLAAWVLVCVCASVADAAPRARRHRAAAPRPSPALSLCSSKLTLRALARQSRAAGGPLARRSLRIPDGLPDTTTLFQRAWLQQVDDDDAAIQNDAPAACLDDDELVRPALHPLGTLAVSVDRLTPSSLFSPRSPRGPPRLV